MRILRRIAAGLFAEALLVAAISAAALAVGSPAALAQSPEPAAREVPARNLSVPTTVSPQMQRIVNGPLRANWDLLPKTGEEWKALADAGAAATMKNLPAWREHLHVKVEPAVMDGVKVFWVTPEVVAPENRDRLLVHVHGGCYVFSPGEAATAEAILMAGFGHIKVVSVDYRMPPEAYFPAALDDAMTVYKAGTEDDGSETCRLHRHFGGRRPDARDGAARQGAQPAAPRRDRLGHTHVGRDQDRRYVPHQ